MWFIIHEDFVQKKAPEPKRVSKALKNGFEKRVKNILIISRF